MSNVLSSRSSFPKTWRGRTPGFSEFNILLNLLDKPALLIDHNRNQVFCANSHLLKLTAFTQAEIVSSELIQLLPDLSCAKLVHGEERETLLYRRMREPVSVMAKTISLDNNSQWFLLLLTPLTIYQQNQSTEQRQEQLLQAFEDLATFSNQPDLDSLLNMAMRIGHVLLDANLLCIYQGDSQFPQLSKAVAWEPDDDTFFPDTLPSTDLVRLQSPYLWLPGKKLTSDLHRSARIANLTYLASVPLGQEGALFGLLIVADAHTLPAENLLSLLNILGENITTAMQHFVLVANLNQALQYHNKTIAIHDAITDNAQEGVILLKPDLTVMEMNPSAELILGYASQEVIGTPAERILIGGESVPTALKSAVQGIPTHNLGNITLHRRRGEAFAAHVQTIPVIIEKELVSIIVFLSDISENEQIRVRTQQLEQRAVLGEVTAIFAHEVRNPINNISTGLQLMGMKLPPDDPNQELIGRLQHDCTRLTHLMESVLSFSRPQEYKLVAMDICDMLERMLQRWEPRFARANVKSYFQAEPETPKVNGDIRALEQVFTNLIGNAVQAMSDKGGGMLAIKVSPLDIPNEQPQVEITVSDSGPGIPDEIRDHIFEPFVTTNPKGTGLGLAITKRIITAHKGSIDVTSFPGGTVFRVCLPANSGENE